MSSKESNSHLLCITRYLFTASLIVGFFCLPSLSTYAQPNLSWNFSQGNLGSWKQQDSSSIQITLSSQNDPWFYFRIDNAQNQRIQFVIENAPAAWFPSFYLPVVSSDQTHWSFCKNMTIVPHEDGKHVRFSFEITVIAERAWIAYAPPYPNTKLDELVSSLSEQPHVQTETLLTSPLKELTLPLLTITDSEVDESTKSRVFILARESGNESASTWVSMGAIQFLVSDNPIAQAVKRRCIISFLPITDRDAVELGVNEHPLDAAETVNWKSTWNEKEYTFMEQRTIKHHLQTLKDNGKTVQLSIRLHSSQYGQDLLFREPINKEKEEAQDMLVLELLSKKYLPAYSNVERQPMSGIFSEPMRLLFHDVIALSMNTGYVYNNQFGHGFPLCKSTDDLLAEGELLMYAIAEALKVPASEMPPYLLAAEIYQPGGHDDQTFHVRCVYRDMQNVPPTSVQVVINDQAIDLQPADTNNQNYQQGVLYTGFVTSNNRMNTHYFTASNGTKSVRIPQQGVRPGPFSVPIKKP